MKNNREDSLHACRSAALWLVVVGVLLLLGSGWAVVASAPQLPSSDRWVLEFLPSGPAAELHSPLVVMSQLTAPRFVVPLVIVLSFVTALRRPQWRAPAGGVACAVLLCAAVFPVLKWLANRPRPDVDWALMAPQDAAFPSGHVAVWVALSAAVTLVVGYRQVVAVAVTVMLWVACLAVGLNRMVIGVHFVTDVLGGWGLGMACAGLGVWVVARWWPHHEGVAT